MKKTGADRAPTKLQIGYLVPEFPSQTHAFFWREFAHMQSPGVGVFLISTRRPGPDDCPHAFAETARSSTFYAYPPSYLWVLKHLLSSPESLLKCLQYIGRLGGGGIREKLKLVGLLACAAGLKRYADKKCIQHIHVHSCADAAHLVAMTRLLGGPSYSLTLHGDLAVYGENHDRKMANAEFVSVVTNQLRDQVLKHVGLPVHKVPVIWMGVDTTEFKPSVDAAEKTGTISLLTVARLNHNKGHRYALRALAKLRDKKINFVYRIVGEGPEKQAIMDEVEALGLAGNVNLVGSVSQEHVRDLLRTTDVFLLTSVGHGEAAPVSVMEAMSCGIPVICSEIGGTPDMIDHGIDGFLVKQRDTNELEQVLWELINHPESRRRIGVAARKKAEKAFDARIGALKLVNRIKQALDRKDNNAPGDD